MPPKQRHADACRCTVEQLPGSMIGQKGMTKGNECVGMNTPVWPAADAGNSLHAVPAGQTCFA